jgi:hypothetical protein
MGRFPRSGQRGEQAADLHDEQPGIVVVGREFRGESAQLAVGLGQGGDRVEFDASHPFGDHGAGELDDGHLPLPIGPRPDRFRQLAAKGKVGIAAVHQLLHQLVQLGKPEADELERRPGRACRGGDGRGTSGRVRLRRLALQHCVDFLRRHRRKAKHATPRANCRQQAADAVRDQQKERARGRFLEALEQGIGRARLEIVGRIDDHNPLVAERRTGVQPPLHGAYFVDGNVALGFEGLALGSLRRLGLVLRRMREHEDIGMVGHRGATDRFSRGLEGEARLADAAPAGEYPGMMHSRAAHGRVPLPPGLFMAGKTHLALAQ